jgi:predicted MFS family arabinose efflux permease
MVVLLAITVLGTVSNNILNVPLSAITRAFGVPLSEGALAVSSFVLVLAAAMPVSGWVADRLGRRRVVIAALVTMMAGQFAAALAPTFWVLVGCRAVQGLACAAIPPSVMGMLSSSYGPAHRARVMSAWAAANGVGQAVGPPLGGLLAGALGWRSIFVVLAPVTAVLLLATLYVVTDDRARRVALHRGGAVTLTLGTALIMGAATAVPLRAVPAWADIGLASGGVAVIIAFAVLSARHPRPFIDPRLMVESRFLRSTVAAFTQMFCLAVVLVAIPLYVIGSLGWSIALTGVLVFALPATMAAAAPPVGVACEWASPRLIMRAGLILLAGVTSALGMFLAGHGGSLGVLIPLLILVGVGVALVQTPAATGATRSPVGAAGAALGLFNMVRFAGSALGTAWVALIYPRSAFLVLFGGCALMASAGFLVSFAGPDPVRGQAEADSFIGA